MTIPDVGRTRVLYLAPWVDYGGSDKGTIDWFRWLDRGRFAASLVTTQPSANRRLAEVAPYAEEVWPLPDLMAGQHMPSFVFDFIVSRGVDALHVMNSRLGFELLADLAVLPRRPRVVVQLHVEEQDRSGYVRLVTRRYGNLVDAFSVTSEQLAGIVEGYDVPRSKIHVIPTGVDAEEEFSPERVTAVGLEPDRVHVLYPGRLVEQKDPVLMVDVVARAAARCPDLRVHVVGEGPLEPQVRRLVRERGLGHVVRFHPPTRGLAGWYAACDLLLMTSVYEGVPYVAYEAMAMGLPVIAPALPGNVELLAGGGGRLIEPREDAEAYASVLCELTADAALRNRLGRTSRERALGELSVRAMARSHEALYARLLDGANPPEPDAAAVLPAPTAPRFTRPLGGSPLVSVIVPCFNDGRYLPASLAALRAQTWSNIEIIVVDDASTDAGTLTLLDQLERADDVVAVRLERNGGPSRARNAALERASGRYVLPVDADNLLLSHAVERLVGQLSEAGEDIGFIYPNLQYFGTRRDYFEAPAYNLVSLLEGNFCDTCSLFDADLFAAGVRFAEDIVLGHEDWDLALQLAAMGVHGEPARFATVLYRKSGFTRSDTVEYADEPFVDIVRQRHPSLFGSSGALGHTGPAAAIKARWSPGVSLIALHPIEAASDAGRRLSAALDAQTCWDFELIARANGEWRRADGPAVRRIPAALAATPGAALDDALPVARAPYVLITEGTGEDLLADSALTEKLARAMVAHPPVQTTVLADAGAEGRYPLRRLTPAEALHARPHAVLLRRDRRAAPLPREVLVRAESPVESIVRVLAAYEGIEWRHHPAPPTPRAPASGHVTIRLRELPPRTAAERRERAERLRRAPAVPALRWDRVRRWVLSGSWMPPDTIPLVRHRRLDRDERIVTNDRTPPDGYRIEFDLGSVHRFQAPGTAELRIGEDAGFVNIPDADLGAPVLREPRSDACLGFIEEAAFPLLDPLELAFHPPSGQSVLVSGTADPLSAVVEQRRTLGFLEAYPNHPRLGAVPTPPYGLRPLLRSVDQAARRHRYGIGRVATGALSLELGALHTEPQLGSLPLWIDDDRVVTDRAQRAPATAAVHLPEAARWAAAPLAWRGAGPMVPRLRATARRSVQVTTRQLSQTLRGAHGPGTGARPERPPDGYLWTTAGPWLRPVYRATHPVTGDELLTCWPLEATDMGYRAPALLGWASTASAFTDTHAPRPVEVPWASRFGRNARHR